MGAASSHQGFGPHVETGPSGRVVHEKDAKR